MSWDTYFKIAVSPAELIIRGTLVYLFLFLVFRFVLRRDAGAVGIADLLILVLVADASQNAMSGGYTTVAEGAILVWLHDVKIALMESDGEISVIRYRGTGDKSPDRKRRV